MVSAWTTAAPPTLGTRRYQGRRSSVLPVSTVQDDAAALMADDDENENDTKPIPSTKSPKEEDAHKRIYSMPALYDIAFGYRDYEEEVEFLLQKHKEIAQYPARRILDIAAGPARHAITALQHEEKPFSVTCIDLSPEMAQYAQELAIDEIQDDEQRANFQYLVNDIRTFELDTEVTEKEFDSAWILLGSLQHLTKNEEVVQCLSRIHEYLKPGGTVIIELPHPRETFDMIDCTRNGWNVPLEDEEESDSGELQIIWGEDGDEFDPITQVRQLTIEMKLTNMPETEEMQSVRGIVPTRLFTAQELNAMAALAGFRIPAMFGALEEGVSVDDEDAAFRMVCVLQKD